MRVRDLDNIFGLSVQMLKTQATRYNITLTLCWVLDVLLVVVAGVLLYIQGKPSGFIKVAVIVAVFFNLLLLAVTRGENIEAIVFYKSHKKDRVELKSYDIDADKLYSVLFCAGYKAIKTEQSLDTYIEAMNSACLRKSKYSKKLCKYLSKYESESGTFKAYVTTRGYYIGVNERSESNE